MKIFRTLYAKIFGWFWLTLTVGSLLILDGDSVYWNAADWGDDGCA